MTGIEADILSGRIVNIALILMIIFELWNSVKKRRQPRYWLIIGAAIVLYISVRLNIALSVKKSLW